MVLSQWITYIRIQDWIPHNWGTRNAALYIFFSFPEFTLNGCPIVKLYWHHRVRKEILHIFSTCILQFRITYTTYFTVFWFPVLVSVFRGSRRKGFHVRNFCLFVNQAKIAIYLEVDIITPYSTNIVGNLVSLIRFI